MTYTSNLQLTHANVPSDNSANAGQIDTVLFMHGNNIDLLDTYLAAYLVHNVAADSTISITTNAIFIEIKDTNTILTVGRALQITSNSIAQLRIIKNSTNFSLLYGSNTIQAGSTVIIYNSAIISTHGSTYIQDIYTYYAGTPPIDTILMNKRVSKNSIISGGSAKSNIASTSVAVFDIWLEATKVGYVRFEAGSSVGTIAVFGIIYVNTAQNLYIKTQGVQDSTLSGVGIVLNIVGE